MHLGSFRADAGTDDIFPFDGEPVNENFNELITVQYSYCSTVVEVGKIARFEYSYNNV